MFVMHTTLLCLIQASINGKNRLYDGSLQHGEVPNGITIPGISSC